ncbi:MAG: PfkB family carbohydrate kinase [Candidatus Hodarchaeales archaeon]
MTFDLIVVGHFSKDTIITPEARREAMGGVPAYSLFLANWRLKLGIVSKCGPDFLMRYGEEIRKAGPILVTSGKITTEFVNKYHSDGSRTQQVYSRAEPIQMRDFPGSFFSAPAVHFGPIINEIDTNLIRKVHSAGPLVSLDPQGYCRKLDGRKIVAMSWEKAKDILSYVHFLKTTEKELKLVASSCRDEEEAIAWIMNQGPNILIVTRGARGASIFTKKEKISIPIPPTSTVDPTGAGDVFVLAFLVKYLKSGDIQHSAAYAGACAALSTEVFGPSLKFEKEKVQVRLEIIKNAITVHR